MAMALKIVLASGSKRRRELITAFDAPVEIIPSAADERMARPGESAEDYVIQTATTKARDIARTIQSDSLVIGADTAVVMNGQILGKPVDDGEAREMLVELRGRPHRVLTGVTVIRTDTGTVASSVTSSEVVMRDYSDADIVAYVESGEPFDKAGGYAIQDPDFAPVQRLEGCYLNVVGFPVCEVKQLLDSLVVDVPLKPDWRAPEHCPDDCPIRLPNEVAVA